MTAAAKPHRGGAGGVGEPGWCGGLLQLVRNVCQVPYLIAKLMVREEDYNAIHGLWALRGTKGIAWSQPVPLAAVKHVKQHFGCGCTVNDVLLAATAAALERYLSEATEVAVADGALPSPVRAQLRAACKSELTICLPFNVRTAAEMRRVSLENRFALLFVGVPLALAGGPRARLAATMRSMIEVKRSSLPLAMRLSLTALTQLLPSACAAYLIDIVADSASAIVTNNRGPSNPLYFDNRLCKYWVSWAPQRASIGTCVTVYSYADQVRCSVSADMTSVPEPARLVDLLIEELGIMIEMAGWPSATPS